MANHIGNPLARLIRDIAYKKGELIKVERSEKNSWSRLKPLAKEYQQLRARHRSLQVRLAELEAELGERSGLNPDDIRDMRRVPKTLGRPWGAFRRNLVAVLIEAGGPIDTRTVTEQMIRRLDLPVATAADYSRTARTVKEKLRDLRLLDAVERLSDDMLAGDRAVGVWRWKGL